MAVGVAKGAVVVTAAPLAGVPDGSACEWASESLWDSIIPFESCVEEAVFPLDVFRGKVVVVGRVAALVLASVALAFALVAAEAEIYIAVAIETDAFHVAALAFALVAAKAEIYIAVYRIIFSSMATGVGKYTVVVTTTALAGVPDWPGNSGGCCCKTACRRPNV